MRQVIGHTHMDIDRVHGVIGRRREVCIDAADMNNYRLPCVDLVNENISHLNNTVFRNSYD